MKNTPLIEQLLNETTPQEMAEIDKQMSNNKQSSLEWYRVQSLRIMRDVVTLKISRKDWNILEEKAYQQAKAMHKEEIINAHLEGQCDETEGYPLEIARKFYNETYGGNK